MTRNKLHFFLQFISVSDKMAEEATRKFIENYRDEDYQENLLILGQDYNFFKEWSYFPFKLRIIIIF